VLEILRRDIDRTMALCGVRSIAEIDRSILYGASPPVAAQPPVGPSQDRRPIALQG
jgi:hypothetical protein